MSQAVINEEWVAGAVGALKSRACRHLACFPGINSMQPTEVVNEAILKVSRSGLFAPGVERINVMRALSRAMRDVLIDRLRRRSAQKRGGGSRPRMLGDEPSREDREVDWRLDLDQALQSLRDQYPRQADVVEMKFYGRFSTKEIAQVLRVSRSTVEADWRQARGRLLAMLRAYEQ